MSFSPDKNNLTLEITASLHSFTGELKQSNSPEKQLEIIQNCMKFLNTFEDVIQLEEELLQYLLPHARSCIENVFEENSNIFENGETHSSLTDKILENLQIVQSVLNICSLVLDSIVQFGKCYIGNVESILLEVSEVIFIVFEHCKIRQQEYISDINTKNSMLSLFKKCQEIHDKYLKWLGQFIEITFINEDSIDLLKKVLNMICKIGNIVSDMNMKSMADNWKGYISIVLKHAEMMIDNLFDFSEPITLIISEIEKLFISFSLMDAGDQDLRILNFLLKVLLKLFDTFSRLLDCYYISGVLQFFTTLYSFSPEYFEYKNFPLEYVNNIEEIFQVTSPFLLQIIQEKKFLRALYSEDYDIPKTGMIFFLNILLETFCKNNYHREEFSCYDFLSLIFACVRSSIVDFYSVSSLYESLLTNITIAILIEKSRSSNFNIEELLLRHVLHENVWCALLAIDILSLLCNISIAYTEEIVTQLIETLNGNWYENEWFTRRPEFVYVSTLICRMCAVLPINRMESLLSNYRNNKKILLLLPLQNTPYLQNNLHKLSENFHRRVLLENSNQNDFIKLIEDVKLISSIDPQIVNFSGMVLDLWSIDLSKHTIKSNNFFRYTFQNLYKIIAPISDQFSAANILQIFQQIKQLSKEIEFKISLLEIFAAISSTTFKFTQESNAILSHISDLFQTFLQDDNPVIEVLALQEFERFSKNSAHVSVAKCVLENLKHTEVPRFLLKQYANLDLNYFKNEMENNKFKHICIKWVEINDAECFNFPSKHSLSNLGLNENCVQQSKKFRSEIKQATIAPSNLSEVCNNDSGEFEIDSLINSIKSDMKNLAKAAKKEALTNKNISDINYIVNQLRSVCQK